MRLVVPQVAAGRTLQNFLKNRIDKLPIARLERALREKAITVNDSVVTDRKYVLMANDVVKITGLHLNVKGVSSAPTLSEPEIVYEDAHILVVNKPSRVDMHLGEDALDNAVLSYLKKSNPSPFAAAVGQLDKVTSGLIIYGKSYQVVRALNAAQASFTKIYQYRAEKPLEGEITVHLRHNESEKREEVAPEGKAATTRFFVQEGTYLAQLVTGRKHQIRVTLAHYGAPIVGDTKYGGMRARRVYLHAFEIGLSGLTDNELIYLNGKVFSAPPR